MCSDTKFTWTETNELRRGHQTRPPPAAPTHLVDVVEGRTLVGPVAVALFLPVLHQSRHHHDHRAAVLPHHLLHNRSRDKHETSEDSVPSTQTRTRRVSLSHGPARSQRWCATGGPGWRCRPASGGHAQSKGGLKGVKPAVTEQEGPQHQIVAELTMVLALM